MRDQVCQGTIGVTLHQDLVTAVPGLDHGWLLDSCMASGSGVRSLHPGWTYGAQEGKHPGRK